MGFVIIAILLMLSEKKKPYVSIRGTFSSFSTSDINDDSNSNGATFYQQLLKERVFQSAQITHTLIREEENGKPIKPFAVYAILVSTQDIEYTIERRYSCFNLLYKKLSKKVPFKTEFPAKAFLTPSTNDVLVNKRKNQLNKFITEVINLENKEYQIDFFDFLDIRQVYAKEKILLPYQKQIDRKMDQDVLLELLIKLGTNQQPIVSVINSIQRQLFDNKLRVTNEVIRQLFVGLGKRRGLLQISLMEEGHELESLKGLELVTRLLNFEQNREAQVYIRNFVACPIKNIKIAPGLLESSQIKLNYFKLLEVYYKRNCDINYDSSLDFLFNGCNTERKEFENWSKSRERSSLSVDVYQNIFNEKETKPSDIIATVAWLKNIIETDSTEWQHVRASGKPNIYHMKIQKNNYGIVRFTYNSNKPEAELWSIFTDNMKWYRWVTSSRVDPYTKTLSVTMQLNNTKKFRFACEVTQEGQDQILIKKPYGKRSNPEFDSFYEVLKMKKGADWATKVQIWRHFESQECIEYFKKETEGETEPFSEILIE